MNFPFFKKKADEGINIDYNKEAGIVKFEKNDIATGKDSLATLEVFAEHTNMPIYKGKPEIQHAYESDFLGYTDKCPLCNTPTQQMYSNFVWANQEASRLMSAPLGHFCTNCPTVIIDDTLAKNSINKGRFEYWGVCAIDSGHSEKAGSNLFKTLNGKKPTYVLNEEGGLDGILDSVHAPSGGTYHDSTGRFLGDLNERASYFDGLNVAPNSVAKTQQAANKKAKNKSKNKQAKQSRKANRKK